MQAMQAMHTKGGYEGHEDMIRMTWSNIYQILGELIGRRDGVAALSMKIMRCCVDVTGMLTTTLGSLCTCEFSVYLLSM
ncbi:hypothetical protein Ddye_021172, partial [Dipteronia dyeriana]